MTLTKYSIIAAIALMVPLSSQAGENGHVCFQNGQTPPPTPVLTEINSSIPHLEKHEIRVFKGVVKPGDVSIWHTHHSPPIVYIVSGTFRLEMDGREAVVLHAGQSMAEPVGVVMRAVNPSKTEDAELVIVQVADPSKPFLDEVKR